MCIRDRIHKGWLLANHPLYGNFLPHQMPYRSLALTPRVRSGEHPDGIDPTSLLLIERAQARYYDVDPARMPASLSGREMQDCAFVDVELLRATIESLGGSIESISNPNGSGMAYPPGLLPDHKEM